jgi:catechol 2,3-dioxygenase-like lactoylglutathione lyase family enzyme
MSIDGPMNVAKEPALTVNQMFAGAAVGDYEVALAWYERLMGRPPDMIPHEHEAVWQVTDTGWIYIVADAARAGNGLLTLLVDDLEARVAEIAQRGIATEEIDWVVPGAVRSVWITDPDGNRIQFGQVLGNGT